MAQKKKIPVKKIPVVQKTKEPTTVSLDSKSQDLLGDAIKAIWELIKAFKANVPDPAQKIQAPVKSVPAKQDPVIEDDETKAPQTVDLTMIRELINSKVAEKKTSAVVALLGNHNAKSASTLDESQYESFYESLKTL